MGDLTVFSVTDMGLQIDNRMIMPGSRLLIKGAPHPAWNGCGHVAGQSSEQSLQVASPGEYDSEPEEIVVDTLNAPKSKPKTNHKPKTTRY